METRYVCLAISHGSTNLDLLPCASRQDNLLDGWIDSQTDR